MSTKDRSDCPVCGHDALIVSSNEGTAYYQPQCEAWRLRILVSLADGEISEGVAAKLMGHTRLEVQALREETIRSVWREWEQWRRAHPPVVEKQHGN